jgi:hypothetical protein
MSEVNNAPVWYPPSFPEQGRLPSVTSLTGKNCHRQDSQERAYHNELCLAANRRVAPPCCKTLHISLFFDGTGNNLNHDLNIADPKHPTNIARLFRATVGQGYAAGLAGDMSLTDLPETAGNKYYKYYMPGVGAPFPEIMDLDFTMGGLYQQSENGIDTPSMRDQRMRNSMAAKQATILPSGCKACMREGLAIFPLRVA